MATYYAISGMTTWDTSTTTYWSATSGGSGGAGVPGSADTAIFDSHVGSGTITLTANISITTLTLNTGFTGTVAQSTFTMTVSGTFTHTQGTYNTSTSTASWGQYLTTGTLTRVLTITSSTVTMTGTGETVWSTATTTGYTFSATGSTVVLAGAIPAINTAMVFPNLTITGTGTATITALSGGVTNFTYSPTTGIANILVIASNFTVTGTLTLTGSAAPNRIIVQSNVMGTQRTITAATTAITYTDFQDIKGAGAGNWSTPDASGWGDCQGNSGITFTTPATQTWSGTSGGNWSDNAWTTRVPLPQDPVLISSAFSATQTITTNIPRLGASIDFTGSTGAPNFSGASNIGAIVYGAVTFVAGMTTQSILGNSFTLEGRGTYSITTNGVSINAGLAINGFGGTYNQVGNLTCGNSFQLISGTWNTNNNNITASVGVTVTSIATAILNGGTSTLTFGVAQSVAASVTLGVLASVSLASATIVATAAAFTRTLGGGSCTFGTLQLIGIGGTLAITGANTFGNLIVPSRSQLTLPSSNTQTITSATGWQVTGANNGYLALPGAVGNYASTPSASFLNITGSITLDAKVGLTSWVPAFATDFVNKYTGTASTTSYLLQMATSGKPVFYMSNGTTITSAACTAATGFVANSVNWLRATRQQSSGTVQFYTSSDGVTWTQLGSNVTLNAGTAINVSSEDLEFGEYDGGTLGAVPMNFYEARIYNG